jgi:hypothetical protein
MTRAGRSRSHKVTWFVVELLFEDEGCFVAQLVPPGSIPTPAAEA